MIKLNFWSLFRSFKKSDKKRDLAKKATVPERLPVHDPLDPIQAMGRTRAQDWDPASITPRTVKDFPHEHCMTQQQVIDAETGKLTLLAMDAAKPKNFAMDDSSGDGEGTPIASPMSMQEVPNSILQWYLTQTFMGHQACALMAQHWLVHKACSQSGEDAARNGWELKAKNGEDLDPEVAAQLTALDVDYKVMKNITELDRFKNIFGIRIAIYHVDSDDPDYYAKPFNIDGVRKGTYKGISQVDPYWTTPLMTAETTADPSKQNFYDPDYWIISGQKYHRSHLVIQRGPDVADILKPTYYFGGVPLTQRIYERIYAAERTANEAPLLSLSKRTTVLHTDLDKVAANQQAFEERMSTWTHFRDNYAVKILGKGDVVEQMDISLADFDSVIMNQYQLVAAISETPATKLLGTSPKGFNATGEFEMKSYHEKLRSLQTHVMEPMLERHYLLLAKSQGVDADVCISWNPVDTPTATELAELNDKKADTDQKNINMGAISPDDVRNRLKEDQTSGYNQLSEEEAETEPGMSPEIQAKLETAGAKETTAGVPVPVPGAAGAGAPPGNQPPTNGPADEGELPLNPDRGKRPMAPMRNEPGVNAAPDIERRHYQEPIAGTSAGEAMVVRILTSLVQNLGNLSDALIAEGGAPGEIDNGRARTAKASVKGIQGSTAGIHSVIPQQDAAKLPKMKLHGLVLSIENPRGSIRKGTSLTGDSWSAKMSHHYGFIKGVNGADGDELDCFVGPNMQADKVFIVNQNDPNTGEFDEHKCMLGFDDEASALEGYRSSFSKGWEGFDSIVLMTVDEFKQWIKGDCSNPISAAEINAAGYRPETQ